MNKLITERNDVIIRPLHFAVNHDSCVWPFYQLNIFQLFYICIYVCVCVYIYIYIYNVTLRIVNILNLILSSLLHITTGI